MKLFEQMLDEDEILNGKKIQIKGMEGVALNAEKIEKILKGGGLI